MAGQRPYRRADGVGGFSRLTTRDSAIVLTVSRFRQASASQLRRLFFNDGSERSRGIRQRRSLARLVKWGQLQRLPRPIGGGMGGSAEYIYIPADARTRIADPHTLDITETYVQLKESGQLIDFDPEPYCHTNIGHLEIKPDAYVRVRGEQIFRYWLEVDRGTEWRSKLNTKMRRYVEGYKKFDDSTYPLVVWIVPDEVRRRYVEGSVKRQEIPGLFEVVLIDEAVSYLTN